MALTPVHYDRQRETALCGVEGESVDGAKNKSSLTEEQKITTRVQQELKSFSAIMYEETLTT